VGLFDRRVTYKPFEYPFTVGYKEAIQNTPWLVKKWGNFEPDYHQYVTQLTPHQRQVVKRAILAISQVEVGVKKFWGRLGDRFPKPEFEAVGAVYAECFADGTEILTPAGWSDLSLISVGDIVAQYHPDATITFVPVLKKTDEHYNGPMVQFTKKTTELLVTPNHRIICLNYRGLGDLVEFEAIKLDVKDTRLKIPESAPLAAGSVSQVSFVDRLRIAIQADGSRRYYNSGYGNKPRKGSGFGAEYEIRIKKQRKVDRLDWILSNLQGVVSFDKNPFRGKKTKTNITSYTIRIDEDFDYKRFDWVDLTDKSHAWCEDFVQELAEWDGTRLPAKKDCKIKYSTVIKKNADIVQAVGVCAGYRTNMIVCKDDRKESFKDVYIVSFTANRKMVTLPPLKKNITDYSGMVRCVTVPSGMVITRYNGKTFISGNSEERHASAYSRLLDVLDLNSDFQTVVDHPAIGGRVAYLSDVMSNWSQLSNRAYTETLALFSLLVENVSLFTQFLIIKSFNKHLGLLKDIDNVIQETAQEERTHALFGSALVNLIRQENPDWFDADFERSIRRMCCRAIAVENQIVDWIYGGEELAHMPSRVVKEFAMKRANDSLALIGYGPEFVVNEALYSEVLWFDEEMNAVISTDFFHKSSPNYSVLTKSYTAEDLF
jgi:ribonucleotide reductase beta subunit family protein with ferritin-like domain